MALPLIAQDDFSAGSVLSVARHLIPRTGAYRIVNGLLDDDGSVYERGGSAYKSNADFTSTGLRLLWDGFLPAVGPRTLFASSTSFGVLDATDAAPVTIGGAGLSEPKAVAQIGDFLWIGGGTMYAGSRVAGPYSTGTLAVTNGSASVVGSGTGWSAANIDAGSILEIAGDTTRFYVVAAVVDATHLTLTEPFLGPTASGLAYVSQAVKVAGTGGRGGKAAAIYGQAGGRLLTLENEILSFSNGVDPTTGRLRPQVFSANDYHRLPAGARGVALATLRDRALIFTTAGMWMLSNLALNLTDAVGNVQQRLEQVSSDLIAWGAPGITAYRNAAIVACVDGVYLLDGVSAPVLLSKAITPRYVGYVRAGHKPGQIAVFRNHLFVPVLDAFGGCVDLMVCRLDRPTDTSIGKTWPWVFFTGHGAQVTALAQRVAQGSSRSPALLAAGADKRVLDLSKIFEPAAAVQRDADDSLHNLILETRDFRTSLSGARNRNLAKKVRLRYESDTQIRGYVSTGRFAAVAGTVWGAFLWGVGTWGDSALDEFEVLEGLAPAADARAPFTWSVNRKGEYVRFRFESVGASGRCVLRSIDAAVRQSRKDF